MADEEKAPSSRNLVTAGASLTDLSFGVAWDAISKTVDVEDRRLTGNVNAPHDFENHNYVRCFFEGNVITGFHMLHMDFKDTTFAGVELISCEIESSAFINCVFNDVAFTNGRFLNCTFQDCRFYGCHFERVDLGNAFIKGCRISNSDFRYCKTANHVFEECLFAKVQFVVCELQMDTIIKNYGISRVSLIDCKIRDRRVREDGAPMSKEELEQFTVPKKDLIAQLRLEYFHTDNFLDGNDVLDDCLTDHSWLVGLHNDFTIGDKISQFVEFLLGLWEQNELPCHTLLLAHQMTANLVEALRSDEQELYRVLLTIMGTHMLLSRKVEHYLFIFDNIRAELGGKPIALIVNGPPDPDYYRRILPELFCTGDTRIVEARPHNSPSELLIYGASALAWFLASLERFRLETYASQAVKAARGQSQKADEGHPLVALTYNKGKMLEFRARALVPYSSVLIDLDMAVSTKVFGKFRHLVVKMLQDKDGEEKNE